ncbi:transposase [Desulforamulus putei]|uniref:transposase n=1 Tax=Desulforamulus putei TaxID=74701 RepID=UPI000A02C95F
MEKNSSAHFDLNIYKQCPVKNNCPVQKKSAVLRVSQKSVLAANTRERMSVTSEHKEAASKRAAIEGTTQALKRAHGARFLQGNQVYKRRCFMWKPVLEKYYSPSFPSIH